MTRPLPQFSLLTLMKWMAAIAVVAALATMPEQVATPAVLVLSLLITPHLLLRAQRGDRLERAFCVGVLVPLGGLVILSIGYVHGHILFDGGNEAYLQELQEAVTRIQHFRTHALVTWGFSLFSGAACWLVAWREVR